MKFFQQLEITGQQLTQNITAKHYSYEPKIQLNNALQKIIQSSKSGSLICLISDFSGFDETTADMLGFLSKANDLLTIMIVDPLEQALPNAAGMMVTDIESQQEIDFSDQRLRRKYRQSSETSLAYLKQVLNRLSVPIWQVDTVTPIIQQVMQQMIQQIPANKRANKRYRQKPPPRTLI